MSKISSTPYGVEPETKLEPPNRGERFDPAVSGSPTGLSWFHRPPLRGRWLLVVAVGFVFDLWVRV